MTLDIFIGFIEEPEGLKQLLEERLYVLVDEKDECTIYEHRDDIWPQLFYYSPSPKVEEDDELPNWEGEGFKVVSELNINFPWGDLKAHARAYDLVEELSRHYSVVICNPDNLEEVYSTKIIQKGNSRINPTSLN